MISSCFCITDLIFPCSEKPSIIPISLPKSLLKPKDFKEEKLHRYSLVAETLSTMRSKPSEKDHKSDVNESNQDDKASLRSMIISGNVAAVESWLFRSAFVNAIGDEGKTMLHYASIFNKDPAIAQLLLEYGADINAIDANHKTPLFAAAAEGNHKTCVLLLENGAWVRSVTDGGWTALHHLASRGNSAFMERLLSDRGPDVEAFYEPERYSLKNGGMCDPCKVGLVDLFLKFGAEINAQSKGFTALHLAVLTGQDHLVSTLLSLGASAKGVNLSCLNRGLSTVNLDKLLHRGANVEGSDSRWNKTPLIWASETGSADAVKVLLAHGAGVNAQDKQGISALRYAAANARFQIVNLLLEYGADPSLPDNWSKTPLIAAASGQPFSLGGQFYDSSPADREKTVRLLLDAGADISTQELSGAAAVHYAAQNGYLEVLKALCEKGGCDLRMEWNGKLPLRIALEMGHSAVVKWLSDKLRNE